MVTIKIPDIKELITIAEKEHYLYPNPDWITEEYLACMQTYCYLFGSWLLEKTGIDRLDLRLENEGFLSVPEEKQNYHQKSDMLDLSYLYLWGNARIERLPEETNKQLLDFYTMSLNGDIEEEKSLAVAEELIPETYKTVMTVDPVHPETIYEPIETIHGDYQVRGDTILFGMGSSPLLNDAGNAVDEASELRRLRVFENVNRQLVPILSEELGTSVAVWLDLFTV